MSTNDLLTGEQLISLKSKTDRDLPLVGEKEFDPSNSWLEKTQIENSLVERKHLLEEQRVEKKNNLSCVAWIPEVGKAKVLKKVGKHWESVGHHMDGNEWLYPEEALVLLETNCLEIILYDVPLSIERAYSTLISDKNGCNLDEYRVYSHLVRNGYRLFRHASTVSVTRYEKDINLEQHVLNDKRLYSADFDKCKKANKEIPSDNHEPSTSLKLRFASLNSGCNDLSKLSVDRPNNECNDSPNFSLNSVNIENSALSNLSVVTVNKEQNASTNLAVASVNNEKIASPNPSVTCVDNECSSLPNLSVATVSNERSVSPHLSVDSVVECGIESENVEESNSSLCDIVTEKSASPIHAVSDHQLVSSNHQPESSNHQLGSSNNQQESSKNQTVSDHHSGSSNHQQESPKHQLESSDHQPVSDYQTGDKSGTEIEANVDFINLETETPDVLFVETVKTSQAASKVSNKPDVIDVSSGDDESSSDDDVEMEEEVEEVEDDEEEEEDDEEGSDDSEEVVEVPIKEREIIYAEISSDEESVTEADVGDRDNGQNVENDNDNEEEEEEDDDEDDDGDSEDSASGANWKRRPQQSNVSNGTQVNTSSFNQSNSTFNVVQQDPVPVEQNTDLIQQNPITVQQNADPIQQDADPVQQNPIPVRTTFVTVDEFLFPKPDRPNYKVVIDMADDSSLNQELERFYEVIELDSDHEDDPAASQNEILPRADILRMLPVLTGHSFKLITPNKYLPAGVKPVPTNSYLNISLDNWTPIPGDNSQQHNTRQNNVTHVNRHLESRKSMQNNVIVQRTNPIHQQLNHNPSNRIHPVNFQGAPSPFMNNPMFNRFNRQQMMNGIIIKNEFQQHTANMHYNNFANNVQQMVSCMVDGVVKNEFEQQLFNQTVQFQQQLQHQAFNNHLLQFQQQFNNNAMMQPGIMGNPLFPHNNPVPPLMVNPLIFNQINAGQTDFLSFQVKTETNQASSNPTIQLQNSNSNFPENSNSNFPENSNSNSLENSNSNLPENSNSNLPENSNLNGMNRDANLAGTSNNAVSIDNPSPQEYLKALMDLPLGKGGKIPRGRQKLIRIFKQILSNSNANEAPVLQNVKRVKTEDQINGNSNTNLVGGSSDSQVIRHKNPEEYLHYLTNLPCKKGKIPRQRRQLINGLKRFLSSFNSNRANILENMKTNENVVVKTENLTTRTGNVKTEKKANQKLNNLTGNDPLSSQIIFDTTGGDPAVFVKDIPLVAHPQTQNKVINSNRGMKRKRKNRMLDKIQKLFSKRVKPDPESVEEVTIISDKRVKSEPESVEEVTIISDSTEESNGTFRRQRLGRYFGFKNAEKLMNRKSQPVDQANVILIDQPNMPTIKSESNTITIDDDDEVSNSNIIPINQTRIKSESSSITIVDDELSNSDVIPIEQTRIKTESNTITIDDDQASNSDVILINQTRIKSKTNSLTIIDDEESTSNVINNDQSTIKSKSNSVIIGDDGESNCDIIPIDQPIITSKSSLITIGNDEVSNSNNIIIDQSQTNIISIGNDEVAHSNVISIDQAEINSESNPKTVIDNTSQPTVRDPKPVVSKSQVESMEILEGNSDIVNRDPCIGSTEGTSCDAVVEVELQVESIEGTICDAVAEVEPQVKSMEGTRYDAVVEVEPQVESIEETNCDDVVEVEPQVESIEGTSCDNVVEVEPQVGSMEGTSCDAVVEVEPQVESMEGTSCDTVAEVEPQVESIEGTSCDDVEVQPQVESIEGTSCDAVAEVEPQVKSMEGASCDDVVEVEPQVERMEGTSCDAVVEVEPQVESMEGTSCDALVEVEPQVESMEVEENGTATSTIVEEEPQTFEKVSPTLPENLELIEDSTSVSSEMPMETGIADERCTTPVEEVSADAAVSWAQLKEKSPAHALPPQVSSSSNSEDDSSSCDDSDVVKPILKPRDCQTLGTVLEALQVVKPASFPLEDIERLEITFDVYKPSPSFKKSNRGLPNYRLVIRSCRDPFLSAEQMAEINQRFEDCVPILLAVVLPDSISFSKCGLVNLPTLNEID